MSIQGEGTLFELHRYRTRDEWLADRRATVGGSEVAAILGISPWQTAVEVWADKVRPEDGHDRSTPVMAFGNVMEPLVAERYQAAHPDRAVRSCYDRKRYANATCVSMARPWASASLDYEVRDPGLGWGVLEIKTAGRERDWDAGVPAHYLAQVTHYMAVTGRPFADVCVFWRDTCGYGEYRVPYDAEDAEAVEARVDEFWHGYVEARVAPHIEGVPGEASALARVTGPDATSELAEVREPTILDAISAYQAACDSIKRVQAVKDAAGAALMEAIGERKGLVTDTSRVTWVRKRATRFDAKRFREEHPDLYEQYSYTRFENGGLRVADL